MTEEKKEKERWGNELGVSGFTLGIVSIVLAGWIGLIFATLSIIFCLIQQRKKKIKLARIGLILGVIGFILSISWILLGPILIERLAASFPVT